MRRLGARRRARVASLAVLSAAMLAVASVSGASVRSENTAIPEIGVTYTDLAVSPDCDLNAALGLLKTYDRPGVRAQARRQLAAMRAAGIASIRILVWSLTDPAANDTNNLPSAGGRLSEPYRSNLINFASDVRTAGFKSLVVEYSPQWTNNPIGDWGPNGLAVDRWDPSKLDENWSFIADTRSLFKKYGPAETWFDPESEMAPTDYIDTVLGPRLDDYISEMYRRYVAAFGKDDLIFTVIDKGDPAETVQRLHHLIAALQATGLGMPPRIGVHPDQSAPSDLADLRTADATLTASGLDQPIVVGEMVSEGPDSAATARDIAEFVNTSDRAVPEVYLWFWRSQNEPHECVSAPYRADSYITALTGSPPPSTLTASVHPGSVSFKTSFGQTVTALEEGSYRVVVTDASRRAGFSLTGPGLNRRSGRRFDGRVAWSVLLRPGAYRYGYDGPGVTTRKTLTVLATRG